MSLLKHIGAMPVPHDAYIDKSSNVFYKKKINGVWRKINVGKIVHDVGESQNSSTEHMMTPNENMRRYFADEFFDFYGEELSAIHQIIIGPYLVSLRLCACSGLYQTVQRAFGYKVGNALMDYATMTFVTNSNAAYQIDAYVAAHAHYSLSKLSNSSLSTMVNSIHENAIHAFKMEWLTTYQKLNKMIDVWLSIDCTNNDCKAVDSVLANQGKSKSGNSTNIISQIWVLDASNGMPITWFVNEGNVTDNKAFESVSKFLGESGIKVKGVLLDRGFATDEIMSLIESYGYEYVIMLRSGCNGYEEMFSKHSEDIRCSVINRICNGGLYGITDEATVFNKTQRKANVGLFFSSVNATERSEHLSDNISKEIDRLNNAIDSHAEDVQVKPGFEHILSLKYNDEGKASCVMIDYTAWQRSYNEKGYFAIATSLDSSAKELYKYYCLRDMSEKGFSELKSQLGFHTFRGHSDRSIGVRIVVSFIAYALRQMFINHCKKIELMPNIILAKLNHVTVNSTYDGIYIPCNATGKQVSSLFSSIGVSKIDLSDVATQIASIKDGQNLLECRTLNSLIKDKIFTASYSQVLAVQERKEAALETSSKKRGRPKGIKNKSTIEREQLLSSDSVEVQAPSKKGRPKGSKSQSTLEKEKAKAIAEALSRPSGEKRKRGRPSGSKNHKTIANELGISLEEIRSANAKPKRGRGRPKGSLNKKTLAYLKQTELELKSESRKKGTSNS